MKRNEITEWFPVIIGVVFVVILGYVFWLFLTTPIDHAKTDRLIYSQKTHVCQDYNYPEYALFKGNGYCVKWQDERYILVPYSSFED